MAGTAGQLMRLGPACSATTSCRYSRLSQRDVHSKDRPKAASVSRESPARGYAAVILRRRQAINPPSAIKMLGKPAPRMGPGTAEAANVS